MSSIRTQTSPNLVSQPKANILIPNDFHAAIWNNGYDVMLENAIACPCDNGSAPSPSCQNCLGTGWVFVNPIKTKALITSVNRNTKYKDWSPEMVGTVSATFMHADRFSFMDKITLLNNFSYMSEIRPIREKVIDEETGEKEYFIFTTYRVVDIEAVILFGSDNQSLIKISPGYYEVSQFNDFVIKLTFEGVESYTGKISVTYRHKVTYNIVDIPHDMRVSWQVTNNGKREMQEMPIQCIARKSGYELGASTNYTGNNVNNNSWL